LFESFDILFYYSVSKGFWNICFFFNGRNKFSWVDDVNVFNTLVMKVFPAFVAMIEAVYFVYVFITIIAKSTHIRVF